jgi:hypothetical protein
MKVLRFITLTSHLLELPAEHAIIHTGARNTPILLILIICPSDLPAADNCVSGISVHGQDNVFLTVTGKITTRECTRKVTSELFISYPRIPAPLNPQTLFISHKVTEALIKIKEKFLSSFFSVALRLCMRLFAMSPVRQAQGDKNKIHGDLIKRYHSKQG